MKKNCLYLFSCSSSSRSLSSWTRTAVSDLSSRRREAARGRWVSICAPSALVQPRTPLISLVVSAPIICLFWNFYFCVMVISICNFSWFWILLVRCGSVSVISWYGLFDYKYAMVEFWSSQFVHFVMHRRIFFFFLLFFELGSDCVCP